MAEALKASITDTGMNQGDVAKFFRNVVALVNEMKTALGTAVTLLTTGDYIVGRPGLAIGSTPTAVASLAFTYVVDGQTYSKAAVAAGTAPGNDVVPQSLFGAVAFDIGADGTIDAIEAAANATGYASAALARAGVPAKAAGHARMGYVTATKSDGTFTFGTTELGAANTTVAYTEGDSLNAVLGTALTLTNTTDLTLAAG